MCALWYVEQTSTSFSERVHSNPRALIISFYTLSIITKSVQRMRCAAVVGFVYAASFITFVLSGCIALVFDDPNDLSFRGLKGEIEEESYDVDMGCLRIGRRADYIVAFVSVGSPSNFLKLLVRLDRVTDQGDEHIELFSERLHGSKSMDCVFHEPRRHMQSLCKDVFQVYDRHLEQRRVHITFLFKNDYYEQSTNARASLLGLDGSIHLQRATNYWFTTTHMCFKRNTNHDTSSDKDGLAFVVVNGALMTNSTSIDKYAPTSSVPAAHSLKGVCAKLSNETASNAVRLFPVEAAAEQISWLVISTPFMSKFASEALELRRRAIEIGAKCSALRDDLAHALHMYQHDCYIIHENWCVSEAAVPFRRLALSRFRIDIAPNGQTGVLFVDAPTRALEAIPLMKSFEEAISGASLKVVVMILTAWSERTNSNTVFGLASPIKPQTLTLWRLSCPQDSLHTCFSVSRVAKARVN